MNLMFLKEIDTIKKKLDSTKEKSFDELIKESNKQLKEYIDKIIEETKQKYDEIFGEKIREKDNEIKDLKETINILKQDQEKKLNEMKNVYERKISEMENILNPIIEKEKERKEIIEFNKLNDNVNLINDFTNINIENLKNKTIANNLEINWVQSVAVYKIIRNNEIYLAYPDNIIGYNIIIYDILLNKKTNTINNAHQNNIYRIKHYYDSLRNNHILLTS